jgi:hypothetical protein
MVSANIIMPWYEVDSVLIDDARTCYYFPVPKGDEQSYHL